MYDLLQQAPFCNFKSSTVNKNAFFLQFLSFWLKQILPFTCLTSPSHRCCPVKVTRWKTTAGQQAKWHCCSIKITADQSWILSGKCHLSPFDRSLVRLAFNFPRFPLAAPSLVLLVDFRSADFVYFLTGSSKIKFIRSTWC